MKGRVWLGRLKDGAISGLAGWLAGIVLTLPFEVVVAWRYVSGDFHRMPWVLAEGLAVWGVFTLLMALAAWAPFALPLMLFVSPPFIVRWRRLVVPASAFAALLAMSVRLDLFHPANFRSFGGFRSVYFTAPVLFMLVFAVVMTSSYVTLAARRLRTVS